jgi:hypothetical protein
LCGGQKGGTQGERALSLPIGQKTKMADLDEAAWQHMEQEAAHKLHRIQGHDLLLVAVCRITPAKSNLTVSEAQESTVGDGYAVSVMSQVWNDMLRAGKGLLDVDNPVFIFERPGKSIESSALLKRRQRSMELELAATKRASEKSEELSPELGT